jgi:hypothetical protein
VRATTLDYVERLIDARAPEDVKLAVPIETLQLVLME